MREFWLFGLLAILLLFGLDYYVFRNWRRFVHFRRRGRWTLIPFLLLLGIMPFTLPLYFYYSRWWEVEPKGARFLFVGFWMVYYLPKIIVAAVLFLKDVIKLSSRLCQNINTRTFSQKGTAPDPIVENADLPQQKKIRRSEFLQQMGWTVASVPFFVVGYSIYRTLYNFSINRIDVPIDDLPPQLDGLTVAQISDIHAGSLFDQRPIEEAVSILQQLRPDMIVITGDLVNHDAEEMEMIRPALSTLQPDLGIFACLGNHEHYARIDDIVARIRSTPATLLVNDFRSLDIDGARLHLIGTDNTGFNQHYADLDRAILGLRPDPNGDELRILLAHDPSYWDTHVRPDHADIDVMLAGHTHGGQIGFEWGPLRWSLARMMYPRWAGLYEESRADDKGIQHLYVNRGFGTVGPPIRVGIRPEITLLTLRKRKTI